MINVKDVENVTPNKALAEQINQADQTFRAQTAELLFQIIPLISKEKEMTLERVKQI